MTSTALPVMFIGDDNYEIALKVKNYIENFIPTIGNHPTSVKLKESTADEIRKYKGLLDDGIISEAEFEAKKKKILEL